MITLMTTTVILITTINNFNTKNLEVIMTKTSIMTMTVKKHYRKKPQ